MNVAQSPKKLETTFRIAVSYREGVVDSHAKTVESTLENHGGGNFSVAAQQIYYLIGSLSGEEAKKITDELLTDPIVQRGFFQQYPSEIPGGSACQKFPIEIHYRSGVMDPWEQSVMKGIRDLGINSVRVVRTARAYLFDRIPEGFEKTLSKFLYNPVIETIVTPENLPKLLRGAEIDVPPVKEPKRIALTTLSETDLQQLSKNAQLSLNLEEMKAIQTHYRGLKREPTDAELETIAQTWSEHCKHKTLRGQIVYTDEKGTKRVIDNLLKQTIMRVTEEIDAPWCVSVFVDNAGVIEWDDTRCVCFKVETHNHPSAIEPFGGANTGVGGVIRDVMGTGLGARPIANTDIFCFAPPDMDEKKLPQGVLPPERIMTGVVSGVRDYGNKMGIPTVNGAVLFDERFSANPLVFCGNAGILPKSCVNKKVSAGEWVVVAGGRTGRDGIHGATFSSAALTAESEEVSSTAVQIGNPIEEKKLLDAILEARDLKLFSAITDCGAGGLSSAVGELGEECGVRVDLEKVPLKYHGLSYAEIWISEAQERMVLAVPAGNWEKFQAICRKYEVEATAIGTFTQTKRLELFFHGVPVAELDMQFMHHGVPRIARPARWVPPQLREPSLPGVGDHTQTLLKLLARWDTCSKEPIIRRYDHEVQGGSALKPLVGAQSDGPSDAAVIRPDLNEWKGIILSNGINFRYGDIDPYWMAAAAIDEAIRQVIAVGGGLDQIALLDNFCWGNTDRPEILGTLVRASLACYDVAKTYGTPFISGKDSLHNAYRQGNEQLSIPGTLLISAISVMPDVRKTISMDLKAAGNLLYIIGVTKPELGGSGYYALHGEMGASVPVTDPAAAKVLYNALSKATAAGLVLSCHDCSEGGLAVALAEMAFAGRIGVSARLKDVPISGNITRDDQILFSESTSRFVVEVSKQNQKAFESAMSGMPIGCIGETLSSPLFNIEGTQPQSLVINEAVHTLWQYWHQPLQRFF